MQIVKGMTWLALALALAGCRITATPAIRHEASIHGEPYVFYQSSTPYVYVDGTVWDYNEYYVQYYGPTYVVPAPPGRAGRISSPPPPVLVGGPPGQSGNPGHGHGRGHGHEGR